MNRKPGILRAYIWTICEVLSVELPSIIRTSKFLYLWLARLARQASRVRSELKVGIMMVNFTIPTTRGGCIHTYSKCDSVPKVLSQTLWLFLSPARARIELSSVTFFWGAACKQVCSTRPKVVLADLDHRIAGFETEFEFSNSFKSCGTHIPHRSVSGRFTIYQSVFNPILMNTLIQKSGMLLTFSVAIA